MQRLEVSGAVPLIYRSLGVKGLIGNTQTLLHTVVGSFTNPAHQIAQHPTFAAQLLQFVPHVQKRVSVHKH